MYTRPAFNSAFLRGLLAAALALAANGLPPAPPAAWAAGAYVVTEPSDGPDSNLGDGLCSDGVNGCTLRAAIQQASADSVPATITFAGALDGSTLAVDSAYGTIIWAGSQITLTGGVLDITISGANLAAGQSIFQIQGNDNRVLNLTLRNAPQDGIQIGDFAGVGAGNRNLVQFVRLVGHGASGVFVSGSVSGGSQDNTIRETSIGTLWGGAGCVSGEGNGYGVWLGTGTAGTTLVFNNIVCNAGDGVAVNGAASATIEQNAIGWKSLDSFTGYPAGNGYAGVAVFNGAHNVHIVGNTLSGNDRQGIYVGGASTHAITVTANILGLDYEGLGSLPNGWGGIWVEGVTNGSVQIGPNNLIGRNYGPGVWVKDSSDVTISGNHIGTYPVGALSIPNTGDGVRISGGANNWVGGDSLSDRNVISGNGQCGVRLDAGAAQNHVDYNLIGLNAAGQHPVPNQLAGVCVAGGFQNFIGSNAAPQRQFIAGNLGEGVLISNSSFDVIGWSTDIGVAADGVTPAGNGREGVRLAGANEATIEPRRVAHNGLAGIVVTGTVSGNLLLPREVFANGGLPIDLGNDGHTPNDPGDVDNGPNGLLNYPVITAASSSAISGTACSGCSVVIYQAIGNPAAPGGGGILLDVVTAVGTAWGFTLPTGLSAADMTLVAVHPQTFDTSEMRPRPQLLLPFIRR